jgi:Flp pilus assembly protein TadD/sulfatase maturation enzyme AslB (radical SAM superfamily)
MRGIKPPPGETSMASLNVHQRGMELFNQGRYEEAAVQFEESLRLDENSKIWNDWAAAQAAAGHLKEAKRGFEKALLLDPRNVMASTNLCVLASKNIPESSAVPSPASAKVLHQEAIRRHREGKYEEALGLIKRALKSEETSLRWNDFAVLQLAVKNSVAAESGCRRALELDPGNHLAAANLVVLLQSLGRDGEAAQFLSVASAELVQKNRDAALFAVARIGNPQLLANQLYQYVSRLPDQNPELPICMAEALNKSRNSGFLAQQCCALLARIPSESLGALLEAFELFSARDPKFHAVLGLWHMNQGDYDRALAEFHQVFDANPADLFAESMIIECEHKRHAMCSKSPDPFEGIEEYLRDRFCKSPWKHLELGVDNGAYLCCPAWLPMCIGVPNHASAVDVWHSEVAAEVRKAVLEGSFKYCSKVHCPNIAARKLPSRSSARERFPELQAVLASEESSLETPSVAAVPKPSKLVLSYDRSCNLACPQCRSSYYAAGRAQQEQMDQDYEQFILAVAKGATNLTLNGSGEVFASRHSRRILGLLKRDEYPKLRFSISSNGQLFDRRAFETFDLRGRLAHVDISIDAARPETYKVVRRGGDFNRLLRNLQFLDDLRIKEGEGFRIILRFVVSAMNYREMPEFVTLSRRFHADSILFTVIRNWGSFSKSEFERMNVASSTNPLHEEFVEILNSPELLDPSVNMGSIWTYRKKTR